MQPSSIVSRVLHWAVNRLALLLYQVMGMSKPPTAVDTISHPIPHTQPVMSKAMPIAARVLNMERTRLLPHLRLVEDLGVDAMVLTDLTMQLEDAFFVELPDALASDQDVTMQTYIVAIEQALATQGVTK